MLHARLRANGYESKMLTTLKPSPKMHRSLLNQPFPSSSHNPTSSNNLPHPAQSTAETKFALAQYHRKSRLLYVEGLEVSVVGQEDRLLWESVRRVSGWTIELFLLARVGTLIL